MTIANEGQMPWIKFNPEEWLGHCNGMSDSELGLFHRVLAVIWKSSGLTLPLDALRRQLRIREGDPKDGELQGLIGFKLKDEGGLISIPPLIAAFEDAVQRSAKASKGGLAKATRTKPASAQSNPEVMESERKADPDDDCNF